MILNKDNFENLYYRYGKRLENFARNFIPSRDMAVDIVHDSFIKLWDRYHGKDLPSWGALVFTIVRNSCLDYQRRELVKSNLIFENLRSTIDSEKLYSLVMVDNDADQNTIFNQLQSECRQIVDGLPVRCREIFMLSRYEGMKNKDIAIKLGVSEQAVKNQISKALKIIRKKLIGDDFIDSKLFSQIISILIFS